MDSPQEQSIVAIDSGGALPFDGRGPVLRRWLSLADLLLPGSSEGFVTSPSRQLGAQTEDGWVLFHSVQVVQIVPEEVHSYWHRRMTSESAACWRVDGSEWLASFRPQHLSKCRHYIIELYDELVEVICEDLIFGPADFDIVDVLPVEPRLRYAYLRRGLSLEKMGRFQEAIDEYERYLASGPSEASARSAARRRGSICVQIGLERLLDDLDLDYDEKVGSILAMLESQGWEALRGGLLRVLYDDRRESWWAPCLDAHIRLLSEERGPAVDTNLIALAIYRGYTVGEAQLGELLMKLGFEGADPRENCRVAREIERLRTRR